MNTTCSIPEKECYWAVLDTSSLPPLAFEFARPKATRQRLGFLFEPFLPLPIEEVHAVFVPLPNGITLACGIDRTRLTELRAASHTSVQPGSIPKWIVETTPAAARHLRHLKLLMGEFEPHAAVRARRRRRLTASLLLILIAIALFVGLERRTVQFAQLTDDRRAAVTAAYSSLLGPLPPGSLQPPAARLTAAMRSLEQTRSGSVASIDNTNAAHLIISFLSVWPLELESRVEQLTLDRDSVAVSVILKNPDDAERLLAGYQASDQWLVGRHDVRQITPAHHRIGVAGVQEPDRLVRLRLSMTPRALDVQSTLKGSP